MRNSEKLSLLDQTLTHLVYWLMFFFTIVYWLMLYGHCKILHLPFSTQIWKLSAQFISENSNFVLKFLTHHPIAYPPAGKFASISIDIDGPANKQCFHQRCPGPVDGQAQVCRQRGTPLLCRGPGGLRGDRPGELRGRQQDDVQEGWQDHGRQEDQEHGGREGTEAASDGPPG